MTKKVKTKSRPLTPKQKKFCECYLTHYNATRAAIEAGYSEKTAMEMGYKLVHKSSVKEYIDHKKQKLTEKLEITQERVMQEIGRIAFSDIRKVFNDDGNLKAPKDWDNDTAAVISSVESDELFDGFGKDRVQIGLTKKVKLWDKVKGLEMLAKHFKLYEEDSKISFNVEIK